jgi:hypothetical protein
MAGPPFPSQTVPISQFWLCLPNHSTVLGAGSCVGYLNLFLTCLQRKQVEKLSGWLAIKFQKYATLQKETPLLTHCTNLCPVNFIGIDNSDLNYGVYLRTDNGAGKAQAEISACHKFAPNFNQADWPHLNLM